MIAYGESRDTMFEATDRAAELMPADRPRYFMGIGDPEGILEVIESGVELPIQVRAQSGSGSGIQRACPRRAPPGRYL